MTKRLISIGIGLVAWLTMAAQCPTSDYRTRLTGDGHGTITAEWSTAECKWEMTAVPDKGFQFKEWSDGNTANPRMVSETEIEANASYTAVFEDIVVCNSCIYHTKLTGELHGVVRAERLSCELCEDACEWQLTAKAKPGYVFVKWSDDITTNPRTVTLNKSVDNHSFTAVFMASDGAIDGWNTNGLEITTSSYDIMGSSAYAKIYADEWQYTPDVPVVKADWGRWNLDFDLSSLASRVGENLRIRIYNECDQLAYLIDTIVPAIVTSDVNYSSLSLTGGEDVQVVAGKLTVNTDAEVNNLDIYAGAKVTVEEGKTLTAERVYMRADGSAGTYPQLAVAGGLVNHNNDTVYYDYSLNNKLYYPLAVPYSVNCNEIRTKSGHTPSYAVQYYDGNDRAMNASGWTDFDDTALDAQIEAGKGYNIYAMPRKWNGNRQKAVALRFPMKADLTAGEGDKDIEVHLYSYPGTNESNKNWNLIGAPYLTNTHDAYEDTHICIEDGFRYVTWSEDGFKSYIQAKLSETDLEAFHPYFVQAGTEGSIHFAAANRRLNAQRRRMPYELQSQPAPAEEWELGVVLVSEESADRTGVLYSRDFSRSYEVNADLVKMFGSSRAMTFYSLNDDQLPCAYNALPVEDAHTDVPLGFRNAPTGMLEIRFDDEHYNTDKLEAVYLTDNMLGNTVNLLEEPYEFYNSQASSDTRFALWTVVRRKPATTTDIDESPASSDKRQMYDILGRRVNNCLQSGIYIIVEKGESRKEVIR